MRLWNIEKADHIPAVIENRKRGSQIVQVLPFPFTLYSKTKYEGWRDAIKMLGLNMDFTLFFSCLCRDHVLDCGNFKKWDGKVSK